MLNMLIVDDEKFEREGVKKLISRYNLELKLYEAESGEEALEIVKRQDIDILLSDIRMNGMDGLELAEKVNTLDRQIKIVFMSAYGEFEYAQKAIVLKAFCYILKPVQVSEFLKVVSQVMQLCQEERQAKEEREKLRQAYRDGVRYEKQKLLYSLLNEEVDASGVEELAVIPFDGFRFWQMAMLGTRIRFFDLNDDGFERQLRDVMPGNFDIIHLNERQCLLLFEMAAEPGRDEMLALGRRISEWFRYLYDRTVDVVLSGTIESMERLRQQYGIMETIIESAFFYSDGTVLLTQHASLSGSGMEEFVDETLEEIKQNVRCNQFDIVRLRFEQLYDALQNSSHFSVVYVKYVCAEIVKAIFEWPARRDPDSFRARLERIYRTESLSDLRSVMLHIFAEYEPVESSSAELANRAIEEVVEIIKREYMSELSVEALAERVFLTPNYVSHLFKKFKGVSMIKFITMYRLEQALRLLKETNKKVTVISEEVGYANFPYFCSLFKNYYGKTPTQYREDLL